MNEYQESFQGYSYILRGRYLSLNAITAIANCGIDSPLARKEMRRAKAHARNRGIRLLPLSKEQRSLRKKLKAACKCTQ